ncbi:DUF1376 domain-containing protein [Achromobacter arsenitoxydans]|uniref:DUF1376 domain-containing protein n=1 Tax=Achromobacter arsenitoxydans SY8 TaxID=477184 RepID=H0F9L2_9BURK|nr:DUF1376 domain-containing protein [Achromobacter arsenitoxydans]EHK65277.1 hypothetical protein KYC_17322 [Achromobacter arsenitoxydans SY8]
MTDFEQLPAPLTPPDCDLRDFAFMPLDVARLRDSDLAIQLGAEEFRAAVLLWCAAWHQVPAASLPDDDKALAALAGYGRVVAEWRKNREGALYGWVKCDDGRLYHPVVAEKARDAWQAKHKHAHDKLVDRVRKANKQREQQQLSPWIVPSLEDWIAAGLPLESELFPAESLTDSGGRIRKSQKQRAGNPPENPLKGQGQGEGNKKDIAAAASLAGARDPADDPPPSEAQWLAAQEECAAGYAKLLNSLEQVRGKRSKFVSTDARLIAWERLGLTRAKLVEAYHLAVAERDAAEDQSPVNAGFLDVFVAKVLNPPEGQSAAGTRPATGAGLADPLAWATTASGISAKGAALGIVQDEGEPFPAFKLRVHAAANLSDQDKARLRADFGVHA